jgi:hypothetical protein
MDRQKLQDYVLHLLTERNLQWSTVNVVTSALRFFVHFSRYGSLLDTSEQFLLQSERGYFVSELEEELQVQVTCGSYWPSSQQIFAEGSTASPSYAGKR